MNTNFEQMVKRIAPVLKRITYKLNGYVSYCNDEDLFQEALAYLWYDFKEGRLTDKTDSYILQGCYFHLKNYLRGIKDKNRLVSLEQMVDEADADLKEILQSARTESCFEYVNNKMLIEKILNNGLTQREKEVFVLCLKSLTTREIGKRLDISHVRVVKLMNSIKMKCERYRE